MVFRTLMASALLLLFIQPDVSARFRAKESRYNSCEDAWEMTPQEAETNCNLPCVTYCPKVRYVKKTRKIPQKISVPEEINCRRTEWQKVKYKQLVCKMVPQYSYKECYRYVPRYVDCKQMQMRTRTVFNDQVYYVPECSYEKVLTPAKPDKECSTPCEDPCATCS